MRSFLKRVKSSVRTAARTFDTLADPEAIKAACHWVPFSISSYRLMTAIRRVLPELDTIIDGGANVGQFSRAALEFYPGATVVAFEPAAEVADRLERNIGHNLRFSQRRSALGDTSGTLDFNVNEYAHASSALTIAAKAKQMFPSIGNTRTETVAVTTLDDEFQNPVDLGSCLLKLDLQGFELKALKGASQLLRYVSGILLEVSIETMYEGEPTLEELQAELLDFGFSLRAIPDALRDVDGQIAQLDVLFTRVGGRQ